jgi:hypothetical protein
VVLLPSRSIFHFPKVYKEQGDMTEQPKDTLTANNGADDDVVSEQGDTFDTYDDDYDPDKTARARRNSVAIVDMLLLSCIVLLILVVAIVLPFVLLKNKSNKNNNSAATVNTNATNMAPTTMVRERMMEVCSNQQQ